MDNAAVRGQTTQLSGHIDLASHLLDGGVAGDLAGTLTQLAQTYARPPAPPQDQRPLQASQ